MRDERRGSERKRLLLEAKCASRSGKYEARVDDVSLSGCFVNTAWRVELNEVVGLEVQLPSGEWLPLRGHVASYQPGVGFGMSFTSLGARQAAVLKAVISSAEEKLS